MPSSWVLVHPCKHKAGNAPATIHIHSSACDCANCMQYVLITARYDLLCVLSPPLISPLRRFPVGPIAELPYMKRVTVAHKLHHSEKYGGVPWGLFLGPQELESIGAGPELDRLVEELESKSLAPSRR